MEPFDSFWEAPRDIERGYDRFGRFYANNYLRFVPTNRAARILVISCGPGYFVQLLADRGYEHVIGIDSFPAKIEFAKARGLDCRVDRVFRFLEDVTEPFDAIIAEQELNHLTKGEVLGFLDLAREKLRAGGVLIAHSINGTSPLTGSESRSGNFDHFLSFTEYSLNQVFEYTGYDSIKLFPLNLYVFWTNPLNYVAWMVDRLNTLFFRLNFMLVGKDARIFTKKIGVAARRPS